MGYGDLVHRGVRLCYLTAPALLAVAAALFVVGPGRAPEAIDSPLEGVVGAFAIVLFVPVWLDLARRIGQRAPRLALAAAVTALFGSAAGYLAMALRPMRAVLAERGFAEPLESLFTDPLLLAVAIPGPLFPLSSLLLGIGGLRTRTLPTSASAMLVAAGVLFPLAQAAGIGLRLLYPLACLLWLVALLPIAIAGESARTNQPSARVA